MKVKDLIVKLLEFDPELPVCVMDWQEEYLFPSEGEAEFVCCLEDSMYYPGTNASLGNPAIKGSFVCIGGSRK